MKKSLTLTGAGPITPMDKLIPLSLPEDRAMNINNHSAKGPERTNHSKISNDHGSKGVVRAEQTESKQRVGTDKIVLSAGAKAFGAELAARANESSSERAERISELRELALKGQLNTPERAARSAERILGGK